jgi:mRNA interferase RelE/StbE
MFQIKLTPTAAQAFTSLHPTVKKQLKDALYSRKDNPYSGKSLRDELIFYRSFKIKRYRVIYKIDDNSHNIIIVALGHRRDIYEVASKLMIEKSRGEREEHS